MKNEPADKYFGIPLSEWIERTPNELDEDAVGLWNLVGVGRDSFDLNGAGLKCFVQKSIVALVKKGAVPVRASSSPNILWEEQFQYGKSPDEIARNVIDEWVDAGVDPDENGVWFALRGDEVRVGSGNK